VELREFVGARAWTGPQLARRLDEVPLDAIHHHTHGPLLRHRFAVGAYPSDFATWVDVQVRDRVLAERLAMVDPIDYPNLTALRQALVSVVHAHVRRVPAAARLTAAEPFDFIRSQVVEIASGVEARTLGELRDALLEADPSALYFHLVEARLRLGQGRNDFARWAEEGLGRPALAAAFQVVNPHAGGLEQARARLVAVCDAALAEDTR